MRQSTGRMFSSPSLEYVQKEEEQRLIVVPSIVDKMTLRIPLMLQLLFFYNNFILITLMLRLLFFYNFILITLS